MRRQLGYWIAGLTVAAMGTTGFPDPLVAQQRRAINPDDIFITADTDSFDPGLPIGAQFPPIRALYQGAEITDIDPFIRDKGAVFLANRSVDW